MVLRRTQMEIVLQPEAPPLRRETSGGLRFGKSRVLLELPSTPLKMEPRPRLSFNATRLRR